MCNTRNWWTQGQGGWCRGLAGWELLGPAGLAGRLAVIGWVHSFSRGTLPWDVLVTQCDSTPIPLPLGAELGPSIVTTSKAGSQWMVGCCHEAAHFSLLSVDNETLGPAYSLPHKWLPGPCSSGPHALSCKSWRGLWAGSQQLAADLASVSSLLSFEGI